MPWLMGIDEAGYGPNLGPLVQSLVSLSGPDDMDDLNQKMKSIVRRAGEKEDSRLLMDDSKKVYEGAHGFARLEANVLALIAPELMLPCTLGEFLKKVTFDECRAELLREFWFDLTLSLPCEASFQRILLDSEQFHKNLKKNKITLGPLRSVITPTPRFNSLLDKWGNKSTILADGVISLLQAGRDLSSKEPLTVYIDKLGGRNYYAAMISSAFADGWVIAEREGPEICSYKIIGLNKDIRLIFQTRADGIHPVVGAASMLAKYLREIFMRQFNSWWRQHIPDLKPTAGYPADAARFMTHIRGKARSLGFADSSIWRRK